ncbi:hypothetical protein AVEN_119281-1 [Araneus ventricosus]|uniref:Uncharacterized protein n=1 Tax=Araneus ventricosus TaxID=182803 RepID=A0A4Y2EF90_ARAVE|nr:hypothetical protein AVEN_119281-1 [Araneus ventricosus]
MTRVGTHSSSFHATPEGGRLTTTYDLACNRPHTRPNFSGIGIRAWNRPAPRLEPYHQATSALYNHWKSHKNVLEMSIIPSHDMSQTKSGIVSSVLLYL